MSDQNTSLPVRSEADGSDERMHVKIVDGTNPAVNQATVDSDKNLHVLAEGHDSAGAAHPIRTSVLGALTPDGVYDATNNPKPGNTGLIVSTRSATPGDTTQTIRVTGVNGTTDTTVWAQDVAIRDANGNHFSSTNPFPVTFDTSPGTTVSDYKDATAIAAGASDNHDYTVTAGKTLYLAQVESSASGKAKMLVSVETGVATGVFTTKFVQFNSTAAPNMQIRLENAISVAAGVRVRVVMSNLEGATTRAQDLYSTICGSEV